MANGNAVSLHLSVSRDMDTAPQSSQEASPRLEFRTAELEGLYDGHGECLSKPHAGRSSALACSVLSGSNSHVTFSIFLLLWSVVPVVHVTPMCAQEFSPVTDANKTDILLLRNGTELIGEFKELDRGIVALGTDAAGTVYVKWPRVVTATTDKSFQIYLQDGRYLLVRCERAPAKQRLHHPGLPACDRRLCRGRGRAGNPSGHPGGEAGVSGSRVRRDGDAVRDDRAVLL